MNRSRVGRVDLRLEVGRPFCSDVLLAYLRARAVTGVEEVGAFCYRRVLGTPRAAHILTVDFAEADINGSVAVSCVPGLGLDANALHEMVTNLIDADAPVEAIWRQLGKDPIVGPLVRARPGLRIPGAVEPFELGVRAILGQQISVAAAGTLAGRIAAEWGSEAPPSSGGLCRTFPGPHQLAHAPLERVGLSRGRAGAIRGLATAVTNGGLDFRQGRKNSAATEEALLAINGIGPWTAAYIALRGLRNRDAIPVGDLGLRQAMGCRSAKEVTARADAWRPWRGYGAVHLWSTFLAL